MIFATRYKDKNGGPLQATEKVVEQGMDLLRAGPTIHSEAGPICAALCNYMVGLRVPFTLTYLGSRGWKLEMDRWPA